jgi:cell division septal protein FtsQ
MSHEAWTAVHPMQFQRSEGPARVKKPARKSPLRYVHLLAVVLATGTLFFGFSRLVEFLLTWEKLNLKTADVVCSDLQVREMVLPLAKNAASGNIFLLDPARVKSLIEACSWVKEARVRKVFPSSLAVDVVPRKPDAVLESGGGYLLDRDNALIERAGPEARDRWPVFADAGMFADNRAAKLTQAWACLNDLAPEVQARVSRLDVTDPDDVVLTFRDEAVRLRLGGESFGQKVATYTSHRDRWMAEIGPLEYVDLRFSDRIYLKAIPQEAR